MKLINHKSIILLILIMHMCKTFNSKNNEDQKLDKLVTMYYFVVPCIQYMGYQINVFLKHGCWFAAQ